VVREVDVERRAEPSAGPSAALGSARVVLALTALGLATFAYVTTENIPVGLLPQLAHSLHRSRSATGYLVSAYAAVVVVLSVPLALVTRRFSRRRLLIGALVVFAGATALGAATQSYDQLLVTRLAIALSHCIFWAVVAAAAAALVPAARRGRALAMVFSGSSLAGVVGVPAITWLGQQTSWRIATLGCAGLGVVSLAAIVALLPEASAEEEQAAAPHADGRRYAIVLCALGLAIAGAFAFLTYVTVFLTSLGGFSNGAVGPILFVSGIAGAIAVQVVAGVAARRGRASMTIGAAILATALLLLAAFAHSGIADVALFGVYGIGLTTVAVSVQSRILDVAPGNLNVASAGNSAMFNLGIGGGALLGGLLLQGPGVRLIPLIGGCTALASVFLLLAEPRLVRRR
jgi:predicted MFS family arabinose efflux permease